MSDSTIKKIDEMEAIFGGGMRKARSELGVKSFGMQILEFPPGYEDYPEHDHSHDGQEEVYLVLSGEASLTLDGEPSTIDPSVVARVGPAVKRKITTGDQPARVLALSGAPGKAFEAVQFTEVGEPDPSQSA